MTTDAKDTERQLSLELKSQSRDMEGLVRQHFSMVYATCFRITRDRHDAEDAAQAVFLCLAVQLREKREIHALGPWLHQVACRAAIDLCRRRKRRAGHESAAAGQLSSVTPEDPAGRADLQELRPLLLSCLNGLPTKYRLPLILHYFGGLSNAELARELACTRTTLRVRMYRGHKMLRESLKQHGIQMAGGALGFALAAAVQWQVAETFASASAGMVVNTAGHAFTGKLSQDVVAAAFCASGPRISHIKLALLVSAVAASCLAASAPLLAKLREVRDLPDLPSVRDLAPALPTFTAPLPSFSEATPPPTTQIPSPRPVRGWAIAASPAVAAPWHAPSASAGPLAVMPATPTAPRRVSVVSPQPWPPRPSAQVASPAPGIQFRTTPPVMAATNAQPPVFDRAITHGLRRNDDRSNRLDPGTQIVSIVDIPASTTSVWKTHSYSSLSTLPTTSSDSIANYRNWITDSASLQSYAMTDGAAVAITTPTYSRNGDALLLSASFYRASVSSGPFTVYTPSQRIIQNNGQIIAVGRRVAFGDADLIRNTVENTSVNGWFAASGGEVSLPPIRLTAGQQWQNWGEDPSDRNIDLINSLRIGLTSAADARLRISLLSADHAAVPILPVGHYFVGVWKMSGAQVLVGDIDLTVRYDDTLLALKGLDERNIKLWYFGDGQWIRATDDFWRNTDLNQVHGDVPVTGFFAVSTPEPSSAAVVLLAGAAGLLRRRRKFSETLARPMRLFL